MEALSLIAGVSIFAAGALVYFGITSPTEVEVPLLFALPGVLISWLVTVLLMVEFTRATRKDVSWLRRARGLESAEMRSLVQWCPRWLLASTLSMAAVSFAAVFPLGKLRWDLQDPLSSVTAIGFCFGTAVFYFLAVPVMASASRMPGEFTAQQSVQPDRREDAAPG
jgi:hypothetical protein